MRRQTFILLSCALAVSGAAATATQTGNCPTGTCPLSPPAAANNIAVGSGAVDSNAVDSGAIVRIENSTQNSRAFGTGTLVDVDGDQGLVVTCAHLFRDGRGSIAVAFPSGSRHAAQLLKLDEQADLAALAIAQPSVRPMELAQQAPQRGDLLVSCGYGSDGRLFCNRGQALGYVTTVGSHGRETLELSGSARLGDSGGPVLNERGLMVAVLFGTDGRVVDATFCGRVRQFLSGLSPRFGGRPTAPKQDERAETPLRPVPPRIARPNNRQEPDSKANNEPLNSAADAIEAAAEPWLSAKLAALLVSFGLPSGLAGIAGGAIVWLVMRRGRRKLQAELKRIQSPTTTTATEPSTARATDNDTTAAKVVERHHNRYVAYETDALDKIWSAAHARVGEKYPGAIPYLKIVEGVKEQLLSGIEEPLVS